MTVPMSAEVREEMVRRENMRALIDNEKLADSSVYCVDYGIQIFSIATDTANERRTTSSRQAQHFHLRSATNSDSVSTAIMEGALVALGAATSAALPDMRFHSS